VKRGHVAVVELELGERGVRGLDLAVEERSDTVDRRAN
jgi:hypothetical protein